MKVARELVEYECDGVALKGYSAFLDDNPQHQRVRTVTWLVVFDTVPEGIVAARQMPASTCNSAWIFRHRSLNSACDDHSARSDCYTRDVAILWR